ncbi:hypothetical protein CEXT_532831 [Caerostris extrusa]|uniref:Uncharacterized protein n=1 Tax=Caerostris extrusa TaxID=172846 RepID=A0AAV4XDC5_CAEEX|nr:hypothetical protein CEXT_532831 [Caerostris extrusa]
MGVYRIGLNFKADAYRVRSVFKVDVYRVGSIFQSGRIWSRTQFQSGHKWRCTSFQNERISSYTSKRTYHCIRGVPTGCVVPLSVAGSQLESKISLKVVVL